jgi:hypothetical protein
MIMRTSPNNRPVRHYQTWITTQRIVVLVLLVALAVIGSLLLARHVPSTAEIADAVNGPVKFERPSSMEYVGKTNSCIVGGTVTSTEWHVGQKVVGVGDVDSKSVDYTVFGFKSDAGQVFNVSSNDALYTNPGANLGLELRCDPATMKSDPSFGMLRIIWGGM